MIVEAMNGVAAALTAGGVERVYTGPWDEVLPGCAVVGMPDIALDAQIPGCVTVMSMSVTLIAPRTTDKQTVTELDALLSLAIPALGSLRAEMSRATFETVGIGGTTYPAYTVEMTVYL